MTQTTARGRAAERQNARRAAAAPDASGVFSHRQIITILVGLMLGMFLAALDQTVVATAIPVIANDLRGYDLQAWATTAFLITSTIATPLYGKLSDIYGRRPFYLFAIGVFVLGSLLCTFSTSMYELAAFRALQGVGAGGLMSLALAIIGDIVPPRERSKYQGYFMAVFGTSSVLGPVIGGFLAGQSSILGVDGWRWIFLVNVPLGVAAFSVVMRVLHLPHTRHDHRIDWPGALALITFLIPLLIVAEQGRTWGWESTRSLLCYAIAAVGFVLFVLAERAYRDEALLPLRMFRNRTFTVSGVGSIVLGAGMFGGILLLPQYLQIVHGSSPTMSGLQLIPLVFGIMVGSLSSGIAISRTGKYKGFPLVGIVLMVGALVALSLIVGADTNFWTLVPFMVVLGLGLGFNFQPVVLAVQNAVSPREMGVATSSVTFFRQMGGTLGAAAFLSILFTTLPTKIENAIVDAAAHNPQVIQQAQQLRQSTGVGSVLNDTTTIHKFPLLVEPFKVGFSDSIDLVFLIAAGVVAIGFLVLLFLPQLELRTVSGLQAQAAGEGELGARAPVDTVGDPATVVTAAKAAGAAAPTSIPAASAPAAGDGTGGDGTAAGDGRPAGPRHQAAADAPTGLASIPADHLLDRADERAVERLGEGARHAER